MPFCTLTSMRSWYQLFNCKTVNWHILLCLVTLFVHSNWYIYYSIISFIQLDETHYQNVLYTANFIVKINTCKLQLQRYQHHNFFEYFENKKLYFLNKTQIRSISQFITILYKQMVLFKKQCKNKVQIIYIHYLIAQNTTQYLILYPYSTKIVIAIYHFWMYLLIKFKH